MVNDKIDSGQADQSLGPIDDWQEAIRLFKETDSGKVILGLLGGHKKKRKKHNLKIKSKKTINTKRKISRKRNLK